MKKSAKIPQPTIVRLPMYFRCLVELKKNGQKLISSEEIASKTGIKSSQFRKDLSYFGGFGIQGYGYKTDELLKKIAHIMKLDRRHSVVLIGAGNLGKALIKYPGFGHWNFYIEKVYDNDPKKIGKKIGSLTIQDINEFPKKCSTPLAIVTVRPESTQQVVDLLRKAGVKAILNFTGTKINAVKGSIVRQVDLTNELAVLLYYLELK